MKNTLKILSITFLLFLGFTFVSCDDDDDDPKPKVNTIYDFVEANSANYGLLLQALQKADGNLHVVLDNPGPYTVFAPDNTAFTAFLNDKGFNSLDDVPTDVLSQILLNHVVSGSFKSTDLSSGYINTAATSTPNGQVMSMYVSTDSGVTLNGSSDVTGADNMLENGIVHLVDKVIDLPTVVTFATADPTFSTLVAALTRSDQPDFVSILSTPDGTDPAPFTVFAPTNDAFSDLLTELGASSLDDIDGETLTATLQHHVVGKANVTSDMLSDDMTVSTLGGEITANVTDGSTLTDKNDRVSNIIAVDVQASNGVVHVIDKVILPPLD